MASTFEGYSYTLTKYKIKAGIISNGYHAIMAKVISHEIISGNTGQGGSKGIPRKNIKLLGGKPLIAHTILEAKKSNYIDEILVSTDDKEIAEISKEYGAAVPFLRPSELATDQTPTIDVVIDIINKLKEFDEILPLQPTSPLRRINDINGIVEAYKRKQSKSMVSITKQTNIPTGCIQLVKILKAQQTKRGSEWQTRS